MSLLFADFGSALVDVLAIIAIIIAGGFIIFFLGDLVLSILDPKKDEKTAEKQEAPVVLPAKEKEDESLKEEVAELRNELQALKEEKAKEEEAKQNEETEVKAVDEELAEKELAELGLAEEPKAEEKVEEPVVEEKHESAEEILRRKNAEALAAKESSEEIDLNDIFFDDEDFNLGDFEEDETQEEPKVEDTEEPIDGQVSLFAEKEEEAVEPEEDETQKEIEELKKELEAQKAENETLRKQAEEDKNKWLEEKANLENLFENAEKQEENAPIMTLEAYEERLEVLKERLKANEKDLKTNKKEYLPLMRVRKNLENDKRKLRRREALVAKQKVVLYGVNNYVDIDEEKAKKLAEDLDLLDGLRASVQHCEEVIAASKERYPILETANRILTTTNADLKSDIKEVEAAIAELKAKAEEEIKLAEEAKEAEEAAPAEEAKEVPAEEAPKADTDTNTEA